MSVIKDKASSGDARFDSSLNKESISPISIEVPIVFFGKTYIEGKNVRDATDFQSWDGIYGFCSKQIVQSSWAKEHIFSSDMRLPPHPIEISPKLFKDTGVMNCSSRKWGDKHIAIIKTEWRTDQDWAVENGTTEKTEKRIFPLTEINFIETTKVAELIKQGYSIWSAIASRPNIIWTQNGAIDRGKRNIQKLSIKNPGIDTVQITGKEDNFWNHKEYLQSDEDMALLANTLIASLKNTTVHVNRSAGFDTNKSILFAQAVSQLIAVQDSRVIGWSTEFGIATSVTEQVYNLILTNLETESGFFAQGNPILHASQSRINPQNEKIVNLLRETFSLDLQTALKQWRNNPISKLIGV